MTLQIDTPIQFLKGVGPRLGDRLGLRGILTVKDLIEYYPRAYEDRRAAMCISELQKDQEVSLVAEMVKISSIRLGQTPRRMTEVIVADATGRVRLKFFRVPFKGYFERFRSGSKVRVIGKVIEYRGQLEFHHPDIYPVGENDSQQDELTPIYSEIEGLSQAKIKSLAIQALEKMAVDERQKMEVLPQWLIEKYELLSRHQALRELHDPPLSQAPQFLQMRAKAQQRIIFEELFLFQMMIELKKSDLAQESGLSLISEGRWVDQLKEGLPFRLTSDQLKAIDEITTDLKQSRPMHRLLQGDVGSGKTLVAFFSALSAIEAGSQVAIMVPTEILAEQHYKTALSFFSKLPISIAILLGSQKESERQDCLRGISTGVVQFIIGTHALIQETVQFKNLGLVVIDEQHRFGVMQRLRLKNKGLAPHFLLMTATPIPRTLALTVYGDLDVSTIKEKPPGRSNVVTKKVFESQRDKVLDFIDGQLQKQQQIYFVYPLVAESEGLALKNAQEQAVILQRRFASFKVGLLHGQMKYDEKELIMKQFREGSLQILVSTTVIEVGVDVPTATVMVIENAERFGLSQLHQLRGRVGRGSGQSYCFPILGQAFSQDALKRIDTFANTEDGFAIAEVDLQMRGPGEFLGVRQSGLPGFKMADLLRDQDILESARLAAQELVKTDPQGWKYRSGC